MRFSTAGDWRFFEKTKLYEISILELPEEFKFYQAPVIIHELIELMWCWRKGVTGKQADAFDAIWENELAAGIHRPEDEAGFDKRCPYHGGHVWGARFERLTCWALGINYREYCHAWDVWMSEMKPRT